ncbi:MAG: enoyl-[acyl-carrier-protein] reductase [Gemmatimonadales bacterium]
MLAIDLRGKRAFVAGVADDGGFGFAIAKALAEAGATVCLGTWPPAMGIFEKLLERGKMAESMQMSDGSALSFERIYPLDAAYDVVEDAPTEIRENKRYRERGDFSIKGVADRLAADFGSPCLDILVHSLANGPEVRQPLLDTSRRGYLDAVGVSAYSNIAMIRAFAPLFRPGSSAVSLTYMASERVIPGYGGGMSSAKAALESDTRTLAFEAGRRIGIRVNTISAGPYASRAASAIGLIDRMIRYTKQHSPLTRDFEATDVANAAAFLASPLAAGITGTVMYVDNGYHSMGMGVDESVLPPSSE